MCGTVRGVCVCGGMMCSISLVTVCGVCAHALSYGCCAWSVSGGGVSVDYAS